MKKITYLLIFLSFYGCKKPENTITDDQVKAKFYEFFETLSVDNPDKTKLYDLVTDDYYIFENERRYTMDEFIEFVNYFQEYSIGTLDSREVYRWYCDVLPRGKRFNKYIKGKINKSENFNYFHTNLLNI